MSQYHLIEFYVYQILISYLTQIMQSSWDSDPDSRIPDLRGTSNSCKIL